MTSPADRPGCRVLVTVASKHGATAELAERLAADLSGTTAGRRYRLEAVCRRVEQDPDPAQYEAVVLGSSVYAGRWAEPARLWANRHLETLRTRPVWLLSSGPIGERPFPTDEAHDVGPLAAQLVVRGCRTFPGRLDPQHLTVGERAVVTAMRAPHGDFRDWVEVRSWAEDIAAELEPGPDVRHLGTTRSPAAPAPGRAPA